MSVSTGTAHDVFLKVWKVEEVDNRLVELEYLYHRRAFQAGVPVAAPILSKIAKSTSLCGTEYLVMATENIRQDRIGTKGDLVKFFRSLIQTVELLHTEAQLLHGDLKLENLRWYDGMVRLVDFGRAQPIHEAKNVRGTEGFEAPEILDGMPCSTKTDAFAVGCIILECVDHPDPWDEISGEALYRQYGVLKHLGEWLAHSNPESRWSLQKAYEYLATIPNQ